MGRQIIDCGFDNIPEVFPKGTALLWQVFLRCLGCLRCCERLRTDRNYQYREDYGVYNEFFYTDAKMLSISESSSFSIGSATQMTTVTVSI